MTEQQAVPLVYTRYTTLYTPRYAVVTRYYRVLGDRVVYTRDETVYVTPEEFEEYRRRLRRGRERAERREEVGVAV
jgi:hypothetical protein